jgi:Caspase domain
VTSRAGLREAAVHIGADDLRDPRHAAWARPLSCRDTVDRLSRLCRAAGVRAQQALLGPDATTERVRAAIAASVAGIGPAGLLVLTFSGHSERPVPDEHDGAWCLHDQALRHAETAALLATAPASARIVVIADTCYAAACAAAFTGVPATIIVLAACAENQVTLNYQHSEFVHKLERLTYPGGRPNPDCRSYAWLRRELRQDTPDVERPDIRANHPVAMRQRPFRPAPRRKP